METKHISHYIHILRSHWVQQRCRFWSVNTDGLTLNPYLRPHVVVLGDSPAYSALSMPRSLFLWPAHWAGRPDLKINPPIKIFTCPKQAKFKIQKSLSSGLLAVGRASRHIKWRLLLPCLLIQLVFCIARHFSLKSRCIETGPHPLPNFHTITIAQHSALLPSLPSSPPLSYSFQFRLTFSLLKLLSSFEVLVNRKFKISANWKPE